VSKKIKKVIQRTGAKVGDKIFITGTVGLSYLGYKLLKEKKKPKDSLEKLAILRHLSPKSRIDLYNLLIQNFSISSMMDITDGLVQDLEKYSKVSKKHFVVYADKLPNWALLKEYLTPLEILTSGEELELVFTSSSFIPNNLAVEIGIVKEGKNISLFESNQKIFISKKGFLHF